MLGNTHIQSTNLSSQYWQGGLLQDMHRLHRGDSANLATTVGGLTLINPCRLQTTPLPLFTLLPVDRL